MTPSSFTYNAMRNVHFLCQPPNLATLQVTVGQSPSFGIRGLDASRDLLMLFAENDPQSRADDVWLRADVNFSVPGALCPGGDASFTLNLSGVTPVQLGGVTDGAPVRGYVVVQFSLYSDVGEMWCCQPAIPLAIFRYPYEAHSDMEC